MTVKLLIEQHMESESTLVKMTHCRKSHVTAHAFCVMVQGDTFCMLGNLACFLSSADFFFILPSKL